MFGNLGEMAGLLKKAKDFQKNLKQTQQELAEIEICGNSAGGQVEVLITGDMRIKKIKINPQYTNDVEVLEDLVASAVNNALDKAKAGAQKKITELTGGLNIPGLF